MFRDAREKEAATTACQLRAAASADELVVVLAEVVERMHVVASTLAEHIPPRQSGDAPAAQSQSRDCSDHQSRCDIERDSLGVDGAERIEGGRVGYEAVVERLVRAQREVESSVRVSPPRFSRSDIECSPSE